ncbi:Calx-beta domain-containing protein [Planobispora takensis]|uniref:Calx-beta domain-containing protein n=1 Tax=Planobispora takensis TaxID=1367882 RepID=UPI0019448122|nr:Calx-beta domain-containing protein [Planobispora takensis]
MTAASASAAADSTVVAWGANSRGQANVPAGLTGVTQISAGYDFSLVLKSDGTVVAWGDNSVGQTAVPPGLTGVTQIAAGGAHNLALKSDGTVVAWGDNSLGQAAVPPGLTGVIQVAAGDSHSLALKSDGTVVTWGGFAHVPLAVPAGLSGVVQISAGYAHSLALKSDGTVVAWGHNGFHQVDVPPGLSGVTQIAAGYNHNLALKSDGTIVAWGQDTYGQSTLPAALTGVVQISAGYEHSLALKSDGTVVGWGDNTYGQTIVPASLAGVTQIAAGGLYNLALSQPSTVGFTQASTTLGEEAGTVQVSLTRTVTAFTSTVGYAVTGGSADGSDVTLPPGTVSFAPGQSTADIALTVTDDGLREGDETLTLTLSTPSPGTELGPQSAMTVTVTDNDSPASPGTAPKAPKAPKVPKVDTLIRTSGSGYTGDNLYGRTSAAAQTATATVHRDLGVAGHAGAVALGRRPVSLRTFYVRIANDGTARATITVKGGAAPSGLRVRYYAGRSNVTAALRSADGLRVKLAAGAHRRIRIQMLISPDIEIGSVKQVAVSAAPAGDAAQADTVRAAVHVIR